MYLNSYSCNASFLYACTVIIKMRPLE